MRIVAARQGIIWFSAGWRLFRRSPMAWLALVALYWFVIAILNQIPWIGSVLSTLCLPAFAVSFMNISAEVEAGRTPAVAAIGSGFLQRTTALLTLGGIYLLAVLAALGLSALADGGVLFQWIISGEPPSQAAIREGHLARALLVAGSAGVPVLMAFWFSPVLAAWRNMPVGKALFYSFFAAIRNWRAFLFYGAVVALAGMLLSVSLTIMAILLGGNQPVLRGISLGLTIVLLPTIFASFYVSYRDIFPDEDDTGSHSITPGELPPPPSGESLQAVEIHPSPPATQAGGPERPVSPPTTPT